MAYQGSSPQRHASYGMRRIWTELGRLLAMRQKRPQNLRMLLLQHQEGNHPPLGSLEGISSSSEKAETVGGTRSPACQATEGSGHRNNGQGCRRPAMGRLRVGFLRGRDLLHPKTPTIICGISRKRKNEEPSAGTSLKRQKKPTSSTRPIITMILHQDGKEHRIQALLDTGC